MKSTLEIREGFSRTKVCLGGSGAGTSGRGSCLGENLEVWNLTRSLL